MDSSQAPPPAYHDTRIRSSQLKDDLHGYQVKRKPVALQPYAPKAQHDRSLGIGSEKDESQSQSRPDLSLQTSKIVEELSSPIRTYTEFSPASASTGYGYDTSRTDSVPLSAVSTASIDSMSSKSSASTQMKKAYEEVRHFAGGIMQRPYESTKHFTILRHSHGLVFYQGSSTSLAISIYSDEVLPLDRTFWLQSKGWTGRTGMRAKAFVGRNSDWLNVTPTITVGSEKLNPTDERAWQRDFQKFRKKAPAKIVSYHRLRETAVVRIPTEAGDGYFQLVMCTADKKKVFCTSPAFRVLSTSMSPSSIRGASLGTLPLELGAMALAAYGRATAGTAVSVATAPLQSQVQQYMPAFWTQKAASAAYQASGAQERLDKLTGDAQSQYEMSFEESLAVAEAEELALEEGPKAPYPIDFVAGSQFVGHHPQELNIPIFTLSVPAQTSFRLQGYYFGWARHIRFLQEGIEKSPSIENPWYQALISATLTDVSQLTHVNVDHVNQKKFMLHIISDIVDVVLRSEGKFEVRIMGFIRPDEPTQRMHLEEGLRAGVEAATEASMLAEVNDVSMVQDILDHPSWMADSAQRGLAQKGKGRRIEILKKGYADTRLAAQKQIDRVPLHKAGLRMPGDSIRDKATVINGFYVIR